jgi:hypothetical protein
MSPVLFIDWGDVIIHWLTWFSNLKCLLQKRATSEGGSGLSGAAERRVRREAPSAPFLQMAQMVAAPLQFHVGPRMHGQLAQENTRRMEDLERGGTSAPAAAAATHLGGGDCLGPSVPPQVGVSNPHQRQQQAVPPRPSGLPTLHYGGQALPLVLMGHDAIQGMLQQQAQQQQQLPRGMFEHIVWPGTAAAAMSLPPGSAREQAPPGYILNSSGGEAASQLAHPPINMQGFMAAAPLLGGAIAAAAWGQPPGERHPANAPSGTPLAAANSLPILAVQGSPRLQPTLDPGGPAAGSSMAASSSLPPPGQFGSGGGGGGRGGIARRNKRPGRVASPHEERGGLHHITQGPDNRWKAQLWSKGKM